MYANEKVVVDNKSVIRGVDMQQEGSYIDQMGYYGNIWVRSHFLAKAGHTNGGGHTHNFDHVTLLAVGEILVEVQGKEPKKFKAPTFIVIDKNHEHKFTALTDGVVYYCVFAVRDLDGNVTDIYSENNSIGSPPFFADRADKLLSPSVIELLKQEK